MKHILTFKLFDGSKMTFICDCSDRASAVNNAVNLSRKVFSAKKFLISRKTEIVEYEKWNKNERVVNSINGTHNFSVALITRDNSVIDNINADGIKSAYNLVKQSVGINYDPAMFIYDLSQMGKMRSVIERAQFTIADRQRTEKLLDDFIVAIKKLPLEGTFIAQFTADMLLWRMMLNDARIGVYREVPVNTIVMIIAVIIYFVCPINLSFEAIPVVGQLDDVALLYMVAQAVRKDVGKYDTWRKQNKIGCSSQAS